MRRQTMKLVLTIVLGCTFAAAGTGAAIGAGKVDLLKSSTRDATLKPQVPYGASLFVPRVRITAPAAGWRGHQWVEHAYDWFNVSHTTGGIVAVSAPSSTQSAATTLHLLETERADSAAVGITVQPQVAVTIGGFRGWRFDGVATGQFGHTFVPFSGHSRASRESAGDKRHYDHGKAFRIIVLDVRGKAVVLFLDSDAPTIDLNFSQAAAKLLALLRFPNT
jgi:hypothetical protein